MTEKIHIDLGNVQKTLFLPLWGRAHESQKEKPLLIDHTAQALVEKVDFDFTPLAAKLSPLVQLAWIMRSLYTDRIITNYLVRFPQAAVVNIGCGLDTTFERVDNGLLTWYDLDLPDVIDLRRKLIPESERRKFISASFLEAGWYQEISHIGHALFIAAGVFYYFDVDDIRRFFLCLADRYPGSEILFDANSPLGVKVANKRVIQDSGLDQKSFLKWGLKSPEAILAWDKRFQLLHSLYYYRGNRRLFTFNVWLMGVFSDWLKIQYMLHLGFGSL